LNNLITILGPTASGKTAFATSLAYELDTEIISADSRQVYCQMNLGTGKDLSEYFVCGKQIPYHLIDLFPPGYKYNVFEYQKDFIKVFQEIGSRQKLPILCGGTGLYIEAVLKDYQLAAVPVNEELRTRLEQKPLKELLEILQTYKQIHTKSDADTPKRAVRAIEIAEFQQKHPIIPEPNHPIINSLIIGIDISREERRKRISQRLKERLEQGMIDEVKSIIDSGVNPNDLIYYGLEYKYLTNYLLGNLTYNEMFSQLEVAIQQFAKRQMTWFRGMERKGFKIHWIDAFLPMEEKIMTAKNLLIQA
jgi:tRNA dimethylallyltransferase